MFWIHTHFCKFGSTFKFCEHFSNSWTHFEFLNSQKFLKTMLIFVMICFQFTKLFFESGAFFYLRTFLKFEEKVSYSGILKTFMNIFYIRKNFQFHGQNSYSWIFSKFVHIYYNSAEASLFLSVPWWSNEGGKEFWKGTRLHQQGRGLLF